MHHCTVFCDTQRVWAIARGHGTTHFLNRVPEVFDLLGNGRGNLLEFQLVLFLGSSMLHLLLLMVAGYTATQLGGREGGGYSKTMSIRNVSLLVHTCTTCNIAVTQSTSVHGMYI